MKLIEAAWQRGEKTKAVLFAKIDARRGNAAARRFLERARDEGYAPAAEALAALPEERGEEGHRVDKSGATAAIPPAPGKVTPEI